MARLTVTLNGRGYTVACEDGQEDRVRELAAYVDDRLRRVAASAAAGGSDAQLLALASLLLADEIFDLKSAPRAAKAAAAEEGAVAAAVDLLARRIEDIAARLERA